MLTALKISESVEVQSGLHRELHLAPALFLTELSELLAKGLRKFDCHSPSY